MADFGTPSRWLLMTGGTVLAATGVAAFVASDLGAGPLVAFMVGLSSTTAVDLAIIGTGVVAAMLGAAWLAGIKPGPGTVVNLLLYAPLLSAVLLGLAAVGLNPAPSLPVGVGMWLGGAVLLAVGTAFAIAARLGVGPQDAAALAIHRHTRLSIPRARLAIDVAAAGLGLLLAGPIGVGTLARAVVMPPLLRVALPPSYRIAGTSPPERVTQDRA